MSSQEWQSSTRDIQVTHLTPYEILVFGCATDNKLVESHTQTKQNWMTPSYSLAITMTLHRNFYDNMLSLLSSIITPMEGEVLIVKSCDRKRRLLVVKRPESREE